MATSTKKSVTTVGRTLDDIDLEILRMLEEDGRISSVDLAARIKLTPSSTAARLKRLQNDGFVVGFTARLNAKQLELGLLVFLTVNLKEMNKRGFDSFTDAVRNTPQILECYMVMSGSYLLKVRVKDTEAYREFIDRVVCKLPNVKEAHSQFVIEETKPFGPLPI
ncbi:MAG: Lrp/AsnC family transcriptional regulator [bacterium]|nr:Lrp/AsnC family transcriptional regulator [bacterium]